MTKFLSILTLFLFLHINAQNEKGIMNTFKFKGKLEKNVTFIKDCKGESSKKKAIVIEITVINPADVEKLGKKIYAATLCSDMPGPGWFDITECDIEILNFQKGSSEITLDHPKLFELNKDKTEYWIKELSRKRIKNSCSQNEN